jgi:hypothetical protein
MPYCAKLCLDGRRGTLLLVLFFVYACGAHADDLCTLIAGVTTCQGNQSSGVQFASDILQLDVRNLSADISPIADTAGVTLIWNREDGAYGRQGLFGIPGEPGGSGGGGLNLTTQVDTGSWEILTQGNGAYGVKVQSLGGNGGPGGDGIDINIVPGVQDAGNGGDGGNGGTVSVNSSATIWTSGDGATGVLAVSQGGNGGQGGNASVYDPNPSAAHAGSGGMAGSGSQVSVENSGVITTLGAGSDGILAQSHGGLGGDGGKAGGLTFVSNGGAGRDAGNGGNVTVDSSGAIATSGTDSRGIYAQSIGGFDQTTGGGSGGSSGGLQFVAIGGSAGSGGGGGAVTVTNSGQVETSGDGATGILAESIGGGGGSGGSSIAVAPYVSAAWGGKGGAGGNGGAVTVDGINSVIDTAGESAAGIQASSIGGGGGNGGYAISVAVGGGDTVPVTVSIAKGGSGGNGGDASSVTVGGSNAVTTQGGNAPGVSAESIGGGGGSGGASISVSVAAGAPGLNLPISVGGSGAEGGSGGAVNIGDGLNPILASITTIGDHSPGIHAMSVGGGGGSGGYSIAAAASIAGPFSVALGFGGSGGGGGAGGAVNVFSQSDIATLGKYSYGIDAQSTSNGGGDGGAAVVLAGSVGGEGSLNFSLAMGGTGGRGGAAGAVGVESQGLLQTRGDGSDGIHATSIGGGGGAGGFSVTGVAAIGGGATLNSNSSVSLGGSGGAGGVGGNVTVGAFETPIAGSIFTYGDNANGILAQSTGGGGGDGGSSAGISFDSPLQLTGDFTTLTLKDVAGGAGGSGNVGGTVQVDNGSDVRTQGDSSNGILAQSIGGGGGLGGSAKAINLSTGAPLEAAHLLKLADLNIASWGMNISTGGNGGYGGTGGSVSAVNSGSITTQGVASRGISAQSVGGGGGSVADNLLGTVGDWIDGAGNILDAGEIATTIANLIKEHDRKALRDSLPTTLNLNVGGSGGADGDGGAVNVSNIGTIRTTGTGSDAILAQSIGGGGGLAQAYATGTGQGGDADVGIALGGNFAIGGAGGAAGNGSAVAIENGGTIVTWGDTANGIYAQSVGGGGGQAGSVSGGFADSSNIGLNPAFLQDGGNGGNGGNVTVTNAADVTTHGTGSVGIFAQSVGGGGGVLGDASGLAFAGSVGGYGSSGAVTITQMGNIITYGDAAHGIFAQSEGGNAGQVAVSPDGQPSTFPCSGCVILDFNGLGGAVTVTLTGNVITYGKDSVGILAQSGAGTSAGNGNITATINAGLVSGGSGSGVGVEFLDGKDNLLTNHGSITALSGLAISGGSGNETVENYGTVTGSVELGGGLNSFYNAPAATLESGPVLALGAGHALTNDGTVSPGGLGNVTTTSVTGDLVQTATGIDSVDLDHASAKADRLDVSGTASLAGKVQPNNMNAGYATPGTHQFTILSAAGGVTNSGLGLDAQPSAVMSYRLLFPNQTQVALAYTADFSPTGLSTNEAAIGNYVNAVQSAGGTSSFAPIAAKLVSLPDASSLANAYDHLSPESNLATSTATVNSDLSFSDALHSCKVPGGEYRFVSEGECSWFRVIGSKLNQDRTNSNMGFAREGFTFAAGVQKKVSENWHAGFGFSVDTSTTNVSDLAQSNGSQFDFGVIVKRNNGADAFSASVDAGHGTYQNMRFVNLPVPGVTATSNQSVSLLSTHVRLSHDFENDSNSYLRPLVDAGVTYVYHGAFAEQGAGGANLDVASGDNTVVSVQPRLEFGSEFKASDGTLIRPFGMVGITQFLSGTTLGVTAALAGSPAGAAPFTVESSMDKTYGDIALGIDSIGEGGTTFRFSYTDQFSANSDFQTASVKLSIPF